MSKPAKQGFWRTQIEAFSVAIVMALVIKTFAFEAYQVPTESMEPTIIGRAAGGDRIIVNRIEAMTSEPQRNQVLVFRYPLSRALNYVKRLVGMPGERVEIRHGDIFAAPTHDGEAVITRKNDGAQARIFEANDMIPAELTENFKVQTFTTHWKADSKLDVSYTSGGGPITLSSKDGRERGIAFKLGPMPELTGTPLQIEMQKLQLRRQGKGDNPLSPVRRDSFAATSTGFSDHVLLNLPISDVLFETRLDLTGSANAYIRLLDATFSPPRPIQLNLSPGGIQLVMGEDDPIAGNPEAAALMSDGAFDLDFEHVDDRVRVRIDGELVLEHTYVQPKVEERNGQPRSALSLGLSDGKLVVERLALFRDHYYTEYGTEEPVYLVPNGHYLFFGDNSANSLDARGWRAVGIRLRDSGEVIIGDREAVSDDFTWPRRDTNPYFPSRKDDEGNTEVTDRSVHLFFDLHGNERRLEPGSYDLLDLSKLSASGSTEVLGLHGTIMKEPDPGVIAKEMVSSAALDLLLIPADAEDERRRSALSHTVLMHYVPREEIVGQAYLVFWPPSRWGAIR